MLRQILRRFLSLSLSVVMIITVLPAIEIVALATGTLQYQTAYFTTSYSGETNSTVSVSATDATTINITAKGNNNGCNNGAQTETVTIEIQNKLEQAIVLDLSFAGSALTCTSGHTEGSGIELASSGKIVFQIKSGSGASATAKQGTITIKNIRVASTGATVETLFMAKVGGNFYVDGSQTAVSGTESFKESSDHVYSLKPVPNSGYEFAGWISALSGMLSLEKTEEVYSYTAIEGSVDTIWPLFVKTGSAIYYVQGANPRNYYGFLDEAFTAAGLSGTVVLHRSGTVYGLNGTTKFTIGTNQKLLIPYSAADAGNFGETPDIVGTEAAKTAYTLTVPSGTKIICNGAINVNGQRKTSGQPTTGTAYGPHGTLVLGGSETETQLKIGETGKLYCYGYITGTGMVEVEKSGTVHELLQLCDWPGGGNATDWNTGTKTDYLFVASQYYMQNIEAPLKVYAGANIYAESTLTVSLAGTLKFSSLFVAPYESSEGMFLLGDGTWLERSYDASTDRVTYTTCGSGNIELGSIALKVGSFGSISSSECTLPVNGALTIKVGNGTKVTSGNRLAILPGAEIVVEEGAEVNLTNHLYIFDIDDWTDDMSYGTQYALPYTEGRKKTSKLKIESSGKLQIDGTLSISGNGGIYTTNGIDGVTKSSDSTDKVIIGEGIIKHNGTLGQGSLRTGYSKVRYPIFVTDSVGHLAGVTASTETYDSFGTGTYYGLGKDDDNYWYQYVIQAEDEGITEADFGETDDYVDDVRYTKSDGTTDTKDNVVGYSVSGGQFDFTVADRMVFLDNDGAYYKAGKNTMGNAETGITKDMVLTRAVAQVVDSDAAADASEMYYATLSAAASAYADSATFGGSVQEGGVSDYIRMWAGSTADATLCNEAVLDLNGYGVKGVAASGTLYGMDSATNGYETGGSLVLKSGTPEAYTNMDTSTVGYTYLASYDEETDTYTFNRFDITVTDYYLELYADGSYKPGFAVTFRGNGNVQKQLSQMGIRVEEDEGKPYWGDVDSAKLTNCYTGYYTSEIVEDYADYTATGLLRFVDMDVSEWWESKPAILNVKNTVVDYYTTLKKAIAAWNDGASEVTYTDDQIENMEKSMALIEKFATEHSFQGSLSAGTT